MENNNETPRYEVQKVKAKNGQLTVDYTEFYQDANYKNEVAKTSEQYIHQDLKYALGLLKPHVASICEMKEAAAVNVENPSDEDLNVTLDKIIITGYSKGGSDDSAGACIIAQRILKTGQVLNITTPFTKFNDETGDGYSHGEALQSVIKRCDYEVDAYLFEGKCGFKQLTFDFDGETTEPEKPKKRGRKKKETFDDPEITDPIFIDPKVSIDPKVPSEVPSEVQEAEFEETLIP
jgi:hypothetical protein